jgi:hypothetical protein
MKRWILAVAATAALGGGLSACETATPYQPLAAGTAQSGGYSEIKLQDDRWRVMFKGNTVTSRATVETYLLYRAAQLTVSQGFDWFDTAQRQTDKNTEVYGVPYGPYGYGYGFGWRYYRRGAGWDDPYWGGPWGGPWGAGPWGGGPWGGDIDFQTYEQYEASAEIVMHHGQKPNASLRAFDARQILANVKVVPPK